MPSPDREPLAAHLGADAGIVLVKGRGALPHVPHKSLVGVTPTPPEAVAPGDLVVTGEQRRPAVLRVIRRDLPGGAWLCLADHTVEPRVMAAGACRGTAAWRCWKGYRKDLSTRPGLALRGFLAIRRAEARLAGRPKPSPLRAAGLAVLAIPRQALCRRLHAPEAGDPYAREAPYLLRSLRAALFPGGGEPTPPAGFDWDAALSLAVDHGVAPLVGRPWSALTATGRPPQRVLEALAALRCASAEAWDRSLKLLGTIVPRLQERGIPVLVLKGPAVAAACYADPLDRPFGDLDLLVPEQRRDDALAALATLGFAPRPGALATGIVRRGHFHIVLAGPPPPDPPVELHWRLTDLANLYRIDEDGLFARSRTIQLSGFAVESLSRVDEFLYLCLHLLRHGILGGAPAHAGADHQIVRAETGNRLVWFVDLLGFRDAAGWSIDAGELWERARSWNVLAELELCVALLARLFPAASAEALRLPGAPAGGRRGHVPEPAAAPSPSGAPGSRWALRPLPGLVVRPARILELTRLFFPGAARIRGFYGVSSPREVLTHSLLHPARMVRRLLGQP